MPSLERIPRAMVEKFSAITVLTDDFYDKHLNDEYRTLIHRRASCNGLRMRKD